VSEAEPLDGYILSNEHCPSIFSGILSLSKDKFELREYMDTVIVAGAGSAFFVFIAGQILAFRIIHQDDAVRYIGKLYCFIGALLFIILYRFPIEAIAGFILYSLMTFTYILCIFAPAEASVTLRILDDIACSGNKGIPEKDLITHKEIRTIVKRRIERLAQSQDLMYVKGTYRATGKITAYYVRERILTIVYKIFPPCF